MSTPVPSKARRDDVINALRRGTVPARGLDLLAVGLDRIGPTVDEEIAQASAGNGVFKDQASDALVRQVFFDGAIRDWRIVIPDFGVISGPFQISSLDWRGEHAAEVTFDIALESAGALTFSAI